MHDSVLPIAQPQVVDLHGLAALLHRTPGTITSDRLRRPSSVPPAYLPPGSNRPLWIVEDVLRWLRQHPELAVPGHRRRRGERVGEMLEGGAR